MFHNPRIYAKIAPYQRATFHDALNFAVKGLLALGLRINAPAQQLLVLFAK